MKRLVSVAILCFFLFNSSLAFSEIKTVEASSTPHGWHEKSSALNDRVICVDGLKLFQTIGPGWGNNASPVISTVQLYEYKGGKVVPATCK